MLKIGIPKETTSGETRVAATPDTVKKLIQAGFEINIEHHAGIASSISDAAYEASGATIISTAKSLYETADIIIKVQKPQLDELSLLKEKSTLIAPLYPLQNIDLIKKMAEKKITAFALDFIPRIARAQSMDILSSMSSIAGYKSVILAANYLPKLFPMMTTAAGTILPAKIIVIGAGVAGLQAIATARRLGGIVLAFDTRPIVEEQVKSLGADFVSLATSHEAEDAGGYAKEQSADFYKQEQNIIRAYLKEADVVITTALIPGKRAPILITDDMVKEMQQGAVIVDLAAEQEGNCTLTKPGEIITMHGITLIGLINLPSTMPIHASQLYARNIFAFINYIAPQLNAHHFDFDDAIIQGALIMQQGEVMHATIKEKIM